MPGRRNLTPKPTEARMWRGFGLFGLAIAALVGLAALWQGCLSSCPSPALLYSPQLGVVVLPLAIVLFVIAFGLVLAGAARAGSSRVAFAGSCVGAGAMALFVTTWVADSVWQDSAIWSSWVIGSLSWVVVGWASVPSRPLTVALPPADSVDSERRIRRGSVALAGNALVGVLLLSGSNLLYVGACLGICQNGGNPPMGPLAAGALASGLPLGLFLVGLTGAVLVLLRAVAPPLERRKFGRPVLVGGAVLLSLTANLQLLRWAEVGGSTAAWSPDLLGYIGWLWLQLTGLLALAAGLMDRAWLPSPLALPRVPPGLPLPAGGPPASP